VKVYAESNFVLELVLQQEQDAACEEFVQRAEQGELTIALPAFSLFEPFTTLYRRDRDRRELHDRLQQELTLIARTKAFAQEASGNTVPALLVRTAQEAFTQFDSVLSRLLKVASILPLNAEVLTDARRVQVTYGLEFPDAIVLATVLKDLAAASADSCFLNRNTKDFDDPRIVTELRAHGCHLLGSFNVGLQFALAQLRKSAEGT
jgi:predicted nucleic acid-binding protein